MSDGQQRADVGFIAEKLKRWIRTKMTGGCRMLSDGDACECPLCNVDFLRLAASQSSSVGAANTSNARVILKLQSAPVGAGAAGSPREEQLRKLAREFGYEAEKAVSTRCRTQKDRAYCDGWAVGLRHCEKQLLELVSLLAAAPSSAEGKEAKAAQVYRRGIADIVASMNLGYIRTLDEAHQALVDICKVVDGL